MFQQKQILHPTMIFHFPFMAKPLRWIFWTCCLHFLPLTPSLISYNPVYSSAHFKVTQGSLICLWPWSLPTLGSLKCHRMSDIVGYLSEDISLDFVQYGIFISNPLGALSLLLAFWGAVVYSSSYTTETGLW